MKKSLKRLAALTTLLLFVSGMASAETMYDDFEDGIDSNWASTSGFNQDCNDSARGSCSAYLDNPNNEVTYSLNSIKPDKFTFYFKADAFTDSRSGFNIEDSSGNLVIRNTVGYDSDGFLHSDNGNDYYSSGLKELEWYKIVYENIDFQNYEYDLLIEDLNGNTVEDKDNLGFDTDSSFEEISVVNRQTNSASDVYVDDIYSGTINQPPSFDNVETDPDSWTLGSSPDVFANVTDSDGSVSSVEADVFENGNQINNSVSLSQDGNGQWTIKDLFTVDQTNVFYNLTLTATDNDGATTNYEENQYISDDSPGLVINKPNNKTFFDYDQTWKISNNDDGDDVNGEISECHVWDNGQLLDTFNLSEGSSFSSNSFRHNKGFHQFNATCTELNGSKLTTNKERFYTVKRFELTGNSSDATTFETENESFSSSYQVGDMVQDLKAKLWYSGDKKHTAKTTNSGINTFSLTNYHEIPLVASNNTDKEWFIQYEANYTDFSGGSYSQEARNSTNNTQTVEWAYYLKNNFTEPADGEYIETQDYTHVVQIGKEKDNADLTGVNTYRRNQNTTSMSVRLDNSSLAELAGSQDTGLADTFNTSTFYTDSNITVSNNGDERYITANDSVDVFRIQLFKNDPSGLNTAKTLVFDTDHETENYNDETELSMDISLWKNRDEKIRRFSYITTGEEHDFFIYPDWASYKARTLPFDDEPEFDIIQYEQTHDDSSLRSYFFPQTQTFDNQVTDITLRTINRTEATQLDIELSESNGDPAVDTYCRFDRKFPGTGTHKTVFMIKTGSQGNSQSFAELNEIYYRILCYKDGDNIETFADQIIEDPLRLTIGAGDTETNLDFSDEFDAQCTKSKFGVECDYQSQTEKLRNVTLTVKKSEVVQDTTVCQKYSDTATGTLNCSYTETFDGDSYFINGSKDRYNYNVKTSFSGGTTITAAEGFIGDLTSDYDRLGLVATAFMFLIVFAATSFNPVAGIAAGTLTVILSGMFGFIILTPVMTASLVSLAIVSAAVITR